MKTKSWDQLFKCPCSVTGLFAVNFSFLLCTENQHTRLQVLVSISVHISLTFGRGVNMVNKDVIISIIVFTHLQLGTKPLQSLTLILGEDEWISSLLLATPVNSCWWEGHAFSFHPEVNKMLFTIGWLSKREWYCEFLRILNAKSPGEQKGDHLYPSLPTHILSVNIYQKVHSQEMAQTRFIFLRCIFFK